MLRSELSVRGNFREFEPEVEVLSGSSVVCYGWRGGA